MPTMDPLVAQFMMAWINCMIWAIIARAFMSWFPVDQNSQMIQVLYRVTDPIIEPFRRVMPNMGMIDLSPLAAVFGLVILMWSMQPLVEGG